MRSLQRARKDIENATAALERMRTAGNNTNDINNGFNRVSGGARNATGAVGRFFSAFAGAAAAYLSLQALVNGFKKFTEAADNYTGTNARLANVNDGLQTQAELQEKIYNAAQRSLSSYNDTASAVAKLNLLAEDAFSSNDEAIRFSELMNKAFSVSGASTQEKSAGMYQLTQAMAAGKLQGDEFRSIMENAPLLAQAIAEFTGKSKGELKLMSAEGTITADIIKGALWNAAEEIETKFGNMPRSFAESMTVFKNWAQTSFEPLFVRFSQFLNSDAFSVLAGHAMVFVNLFVAGMDLIFDILEAFYNMVGAVGQFFTDNWSWIAPILVVIAVVLGSIVAILAAKYAWLGLVRTATLAWAAAQWIVDAAYLASPITWVIIAIIAVIALVVTAIVMWGEQSAQVIGFIAGLFTALGAYLYNQIAFWWNMFMAFAEFLINLFIDPTYAIKKLFYDVVMNVINYMSGMAGSFDNAANVLGDAFVTGANIAIKAINWVIEALNQIPGIDLGTMNTLSAGAGSNFSSKLKNFAANLEAPTSSKNVVSLPKMNMQNVPAAFNAGQEWGYNSTMNVSESLNGLLDKAKGLVNLGGTKGNPLNDAASLMDSIANMSPTAAGTPAGALDDGKLKGGKLDKVGKIEDKINLADEYLEIFRDIAEARSIRNIITLTPTLRVNNSVSVPDGVRQGASVSNNRTVTNNVTSSPVINNYNTISKDVDVEEMLNKMEQSLEQEREYKVKGVYE
ncbi:MAG TPA: tape measure protein [Ureibacillus sp.]|nr:tape measure protein [Ureibacillus sp.]